jgi:hypothetical protein
MSYVRTANLAHCGNGLAHGAGLPVRGWRSDRFYGRNEFSCLLEQHRLVLSVPSPRRWTSTLDLSTTWLSWRAHAGLPMPPRLSHGQPAAERQERLVEEMGRRLAMKASAGCPMRQPAHGALDTVG